MKDAGMRKKNILLILSDDHGYADLAFKAQRDDVRTPALDRLARTGVSFERAYVSAPICSPSRAGLIAGAYQQRWGAHWFDDASFPPEGYELLPELLREAGYRTGYFGKVHYGADRYGGRSCPDQHGFEESFYGLAALSMGRLHYLCHGEEEVRRRGADYSRRHGVEPLVENGEKVSCHEHLTRAFARRAEAFMAKEEERPFFCMLCFNAVHNFCWQLPEEELERRALPKRADFDPACDEYLDWYDGAISPHLEHGRDYYLAQLECMDREIGRLLDFLEEQGLREETLVLYLTDNGGSRCNYGENAPLHGSKYSLFEGGIRVPLLASMPGSIREGRRVSELVSSLDVLASCAELAEIRRPLRSDGHSFLPLLRGEMSEAERQFYRERVLYFDTKFQWALVTAEDKLRYTEEDSPYTDALLKTEHTDCGRGLSYLRAKDGLFPEDEVRGTGSEEEETRIRQLLRCREEFLRAFAEGRSLRRDKKKRENSV